ncbi:DHA1 family tetracycline resistance protein-like MFS transporter [Novosphingobium kunmingense]|uniref:DHA1 family tetracycline resistance protein-like MFS transporter n=1 Tax=Novosphingobium kunmingense TaxID=1211806 RepID=A0A2N0HJT8_9SPHN|nr:TCR/Tet family MFS transporter [Novosphingobium kunmingense]PKB19211.1 DHA1 family tetracycline resistance protein-like MFS transporter [Novosphingobium kunmingense]
MIGELLMPHRASIGVVFAIVLIDMLGFGIVMPVLPRLIMDLGQMPIDSAAVFAGWLGAGYAMMQFVFAPIIGNLSDRFGRRPVLLASVAAMAIDYALLGFSQALWWLVVGRVVAGITGASWSAAYAYIADVTPPEKRAASFGLMGMAFGLGFILGPAAGGLLGAIDLRLPFFAAAGLALANVLFGLAVLRESLPADKRRPFDWGRANAFAALKVLKGQSGRVLWFVAALGVWQLAHTVYPVIWSYFTIAAYGFDEAQIGLSLAVVGIVSALVQGVGLRFALPHLGERGAVITGVAGFVIAAVMYVFAGSTAAIYAAIAVGGLQGFIAPSIQALNSGAVDAASQGELQGATQSISSIAQIVGPPLYTGIFAQFSGPQAVARLPAMPLLVAGGFALVALALFLRGARSLSGPLPAPSP